MRPTPITSFSGPHRYLSNFFICRVEFGGLIFTSSEAVYQAAKCAEPELRGRFTSLSPSEAKRYGQKVKRRPDFEEKKLRIMYKILKAKFEQNEELRKKLEDTDPAELIEGNTWGDCFWGVCQGQGHNWLGKLLMELRTEFLIPF